MTSQFLRIFLSTVSAEFRSYRDQLRTDLTRHNLEVKVQEDFKDYGGELLDKLDQYIACCDVVIHLTGDMTGSFPGPLELSKIKAKYPDLGERFRPLAEAFAQNEPISFTQWEAWLALYHRKFLTIAVPETGAPRDEAYKPDDSGRAAQAAHLRRLKAVERYPGSTFKNVDDLSKKIAYSVILDKIAELSKPKPTSTRRPQNLPFPSLGPLFKGREGFLQTLHDTLSGKTQAAAVAGKALHGLGGVGKTRLAVEYAWRHEADYSALLFLRAETPDLLATSLAALAGPDILDLPQKDAPQDRVKIQAALEWLAAHPGWLMIIDNIDDPKAAKALQELLIKLRGGRVLITGRVANFPGNVKKLELGTLAEGDAAAFLLERTEGDREASADDPALARELAQELGGLALGLEQAGAYIAHERISFTRYLKIWRDKRDSLLGWADADLTGTEKSLATTWATSLDRLSAHSRRLLERLAFFAPEPVPKSLLDVEVPEDVEGYDARSAYAGLAEFSLVSAAEIETGKEK